MSGHRVVNNADIHFYTASKYAVTALTEGLRQELREAKTHIRATVRAGGSRCASDKHFIYLIWLLHVQRLFGTKSMLFLSFFKSVFLLA